LIFSPFSQKTYIPGIFPDKFTRIKTLKIPADKSHQPLWETPGRLFIPDPAPVRETAACPSATRSNYENKAARLKRTALPHSGGKLV